MKNHFHYFFPSEPEKSDLPDVKKDYKTLFSLFDSLWHFSKITERDAFRYTSFLTRYKMKRLLSQKAIDGTLSFTFMKFCRNARDFFKFFAPIDLNIPIFCKYWGAVYYIIDEKVNDGIISYLHSNVNEKIIGLPCRKADIATI